MDETQRMLDLLNSTFPDLASMSPREAREAADARVRPAPNPEDVAATDDQVLSADGHDVTIRIYHPHDRDPGMPLTVYAHGGGFLHGSIASHDSFCRRWAKGTGSTVASVEYRLAPEHRPADAAADVAAAARWAAALSPTGTVLLAGDSAGATAAAQASLVLAKDPVGILAGQVIAYPMLDPECASESHRTRATGYFVTHRQIRYYWDTALTGGTPSGEDTPWLADSLPTLPATIVVIGGLDVLSDEGREYASRLRAADTPVILRDYPDQFHGFLTMPGYGPGESARELLWSDIRATFSTARAADPATTSPTELAHEGVSS
ncbi:alpha/beta hydrolase [Microbacterium sp. CFH 31415]|uniref:alpha/beta hydrolase fold domain-containing protein n=1 Tax=Microbacterium sp. CFH 31415 TaxID=2921732 RepID=UPI001F14132F|nr:alpha/beta hydrolase fold domain-containing protein [Microbacterium sp. CFH 31415]MCH6231643.1 alpha/beta hydrolase [Microbacterium sp. CFH 31415]